MINSDPQRKIYEIFLNYWRYFLYYKLRSFSTVITKSNLETNFLLPWLASSVISKFVSRIHSIICEYFSYLWLRIDFPCTRKLDKHKEEGLELLFVMQSFKICRSVSKCFFARNSSSYFTYTVFKYFKSLNKERNITDHRILQKNTLPTQLSWILIFHF